MPLTITAGSAATDRYGDFEMGVYTLTLDSLKLIDSQKYVDKDGNAKKQVQCEFHLPDVLDEETVRPVTVRTWLGASLLPPNPGAKSDMARKGSYLWKLVEVTTGHQCAQDEMYDLEQLLGQSCRAVCFLNERGYPTITNSTFAPLGKTRSTPAPAPARAQSALPTSPAPARTVNPATGEVAYAAPTSDAAGGRGPLTDRQLRQIVALMGSEGLDETTVNAHCQAQYGRNYDELDERQADELRGAISDGTLVPF